MYERTQDQVNLLPSMKSESMNAAQMISNATIQSQQKSLTNYIKQIGSLVSREKNLMVENSELRVKNRDLLTQLEESERCLAEERENSNNLNFEAMRLLENFEKAQARADRAEDTLN